MSCPLFGVPTVLYFRDTVFWRILFSNRPKLGKYLVTCLVLLFIDWQRTNWFETIESFFLILFRIMNQESPFSSLWFESKDYESLFLFYCFETVNQESTFYQSLLLLTQFSSFYRFHISLSGVLISVQCGFVLMHSFRSWFWRKMRIKGVVVVSNHKGCLKLQFET